MKQFSHILLACLATITLSSSIAYAQFAPKPVGTLNRDYLPYKEGEVGVDEKLGAVVSDALTFTAEDDSKVTLGSFLHQNRPIILWMGYYECPMLCDKMSAGMVDAVKQVQLDAGREFAIVNVSIDPNESSGLAAAKKKTYLKELGQPGNAKAWNLLTGSPESIKQLASEVGYKYKLIDNKGEPEYVHPAVLIILDASGKISRYVYPDGEKAGVGFNPRTMQLALTEAGDGKVGSVIDRVFLTCLAHWDGTAGKYTASVLKLMTVGGAVTLVVMGGILLPLWIRAARGRERLGNPAAA